MKLILTSLLILSGLSITSTYATEKVKASNAKILVTKAELRDMLETMHENLMAERATKLEMKKQASKKEQQKERFFSRANRDFR